MIRSRGAVWIALVGLGACRSSGVALTDAQRATITGDIVARVNTLTAAAATLDEAGTFALFTDSSDAWIVSEGRAFGVEEFRSLWATAARTLRRQDFADVQTVVQVLAPDIAVSTTTAGYSATDTTGTTDSPDTFAITVVWTRSDSAWTIVNAHQSLQRGFEAR